MFTSPSITNQNAQLHLPVEYSLFMRPSHGKVKKRKRKIIVEGEGKSNSYQKRNVPPTSPLPPPPADHSCLGAMKGSLGAEEWTVRGSFTDCLPDCWLRLFTLAGQRLFSRSASVIGSLYGRYYLVLEKRGRSINT